MYIAVSCLHDNILTTYDGNRKIGCFSFFLKICVFVLFINGCLFSDNAFSWSS